LHEVEPQRKPPHAIGTDGGQLPRPSHVAAPLATPFWQLAARHATVGPAKPPQVARCTPSQLAAAHGLLVVPLGQADLAPCGEPATGAQTPSVPVTSHASHWPWQAALQQKPSTHVPPSQSPVVMHVPASALPARNASDAARAIARQVVVHRIVPRVLGGGRARERGAIERRSARQSGALLTAARVAAFEDP
jgi:hypothetical protein